MKESEEEGLKDRNKKQIKSALITFCLEYTLSAINYLLRYPLVKFQSKQINQRNKNKIKKKNK